MAVKFVLLSNYDSFMSIRQPWNELVKNSDVDHAFMRHEWFDCWIRYLGGPKMLAIITAYEDGQLIAVAPMQIVKERIKGVPISVLRFLSSGITPRCNFINHESFETDLLFDFIFSMKNWDLLIANNIDTVLETTKSFLEYLKQRDKIKYQGESGRTSPFLKTDCSWDEHRKTLSKSFRNNLNTTLNRLKKTNSYKIIKITEYNEFDNILDRLLQTSSKSWKGQVGTDLKSTPSLLSFYKDFTRKSSDLKLFELWALEIDNKIAAFDYHLKCENTLSLIRTDFDLDFKFYNPGNALKLFILEDVFKRDGVWEYDMGGQAANYKTKWTNNLREHLNVTAANSSLYGNLLMFGKTKILPFIKKFRSKHQGNNF